MKDYKRHTCWLTHLGVKRINDELDYIRLIKLPEIRERNDERKDADMRDCLKRMLQLNQWLHYNGNPETNGSMKGVFEE